MTRVKYSGPVEMTEASEQGIDREAAYEEFRQYLTRMIHDFDAAGLTGKPKQQAQASRVESGTPPPFGDERQDLVQSPGRDFEKPSASEQQPADQGRRTEDDVRTELKAIQNELIVEIREAYQAVDEFVGSAETLPKQRPLDKASGLQKDELHRSVSWLYNEMLEELRATVSQQEEALNRILADLVHVQQETQAELRRIVIELELKAVALGDYLGPS